MAISHGHHSQCYILKNGYTRQIETVNKKKAIRILGIWSHHPSRQVPELTARMVTELLDHYEWSVVEHPPYSPDLAPRDFWLFPKMKELLRIHGFKTEEDIMSVTKKPSGSWTKTLRHSL
ncbi:histone-lysine N-methyltransferase SETMAR [Plakobranchus ocellatus]|uniref:Histone-lysine N-methyltransferase SETMAR n=1 Tax=Plakobranchus ocellatus TaxID=259542 RepID=A0AAV3Z9M9_9GAST|nr:histone-lysine N-methyltransferase SETMAR [Plakobranchus ocellatus]